MIPEKVSKIDLITLVALPTAYVLALNLGCMAEDFAVSMQTIGNLR